MMSKLLRALHSQVLHVFPSAIEGILHCVAEYNRSQSSAPPLAEDDLYGFEPKQQANFISRPNESDDEDNEPDFNEREHEDQVW